MGLASVLSSIQVDKTMVRLVYTTLISVNLAQYEIFYFKVCIFWQGWYYNKLQ